MDATSPESRTALMVAAYRARASVWPRPIMIDPWAEAIAGDEGHAIARALDPKFPAMETWLALRVAYLDRLVHLAVDRLGARQIVILGAGYDTRAARLPRAGVQFFEVDHPATQAAKRARLAQLPGYPIDAARYVDCDFERQDPIDRLRAADFRAAEPALVIWEGVTPYLTEAAVRATAARIATGLEPRSVLGFDFVGKRLVDDDARLNPRDRGQRDFVKDLGEPVRFGSNDILPLLHDAGFRWVRVLDFNELALELLGDYDRDRLFRFQSIALASRTVPGAGWP